MVSALRWGRPQVGERVGVILAGGRSRRMGQPKALLPFRGKPLIEHTQDVLKATGLRTILISGQVDGYACVADDVPFAGPAVAIRSVVARYSPCAGFLCLPIDMPLLTPTLLGLLLRQTAGAYFHEWPLPAFLVPPFPESCATSMRGLLADYGVASVELPACYRSEMKNCNTPSEWQEVARDECENYGDIRDFQNQ